MAKWQDDLRPASFRGVPFKIDSHQYTGGRRVTFHEFPDRDIPFPEDLGQVGQTFKIQGYLIGDDIKDQKKKMADAANAKGPAELVHPYLGTLKVQCGAFSIDENKGDGRYVSISFQFYEAGDNRFPNNTDDKQDILADKASAALGASKNAFDKKFSIAGLPGFAVDSARSAVAQLADAFSNATKGLAQKSEEISALAFNIRNLKAEALDLINAPAELSKRIQDSFDLLNDALGGNKEAYQAISLMNGFIPNIDDSPYTTPTREREADNTGAFTDFIQQTATINATLVASDTTFESTDAVVAVREELAENMEKQILKTDDDEVFQKLQDLKAQMVRVLPDTDIQLPNVQSYTVKATVPSLVLAYDLFENLDSEQDLINRNKIKNPAFIQGGTTLEVINVRTSA